MVESCLFVWYVVIVEELFDPFLILLLRDQKLSHETTSMILIL
jgi:hypothetical protein